jgi:Fe-S cluster assembly protein SufD
MNINAGFVRNDAQVRLIGEQSQGFLFGVSVLDGAQYVDNHTVVDHVVPHCHSEELYKGVYNGSSTGVFNGKIFVRPQAQKTTAYQSSHSLLLSGKAQVNAKPQLEIWADDVKCSHGATTGQLNEDAVFYLQARGLERSKAVAMLTNAFAAEVIEKLPHAGLQQHLLLRLADKLGASGL